MHTLPAARLVGHDFLGNHIGELLFRQPANKPPAAVKVSSTVKGSSSGSTVCPSDSKTVRRESIVSHHSALVAPSSGAHSDGQDVPTSLDSLFGIGVNVSPACPTDRVASPAHSSEGSGSEPGSVDSRSGSADADLNLHLSQLSISHKKMTAGGGPTSPSISFVTNFGAKKRSSGSRRGTSEASSASYFGVSSPRSSASMSPMEQQGSINWNIPFREQHQSFANAIGHNAWLDRKPSQQSQSSESSQPLQPLTSRRDQSAKSAKPIASTGAATINAKSQSFSEASQPVRQRFNRAATESTPEPIIQRQQPLGLPDEVPTPSAIGLAPSKSMGATTSGLLGHRRKASLVPKEGDERTFCFVDNGLSEVESNGSLPEDPLPSSTPLASVPERCASQSSLKSSPRSSYKEVVEVQYSAHQRATSAGDRLSRCASTLSNQSKSISKPATAETVPEHAKSASLGASSARSTSANQSSAQAPAFVLKSSLPATQDGSSRPKRRLRIQPNNMQSRQTLLEKTMEQQRQASDAAIAANANGLPTTEPKRPAPTARVSESKLMSTPNDTGDIKERYDPIAHDAEKRVFRIQTATPPADASAFPFILSGTDRSRTGVPVSRTRTSDWAREQSLLTGPPPSLGQAAVDLGSSCTSSLTPDASTMASAAGPQSLSRHHTASHSSTSSGSGSSMDAPDLLSPAETELSTPELESPPEEAILDSKSVPQRRASPPSA